MKFKIGDKVIIKSKHGKKRNLKHSVIYLSLKKLKQPYAYISDINNAAKIYILDTNLNNYKTGDHYEEKDLESYLKYERKEKLKKLNEQISNM